MHAILQYYLTILYSTSSKKIVINSIKLRIQNIKPKNLQDINQLVIKRSCQINANKKHKNTHNGDHSQVKRKADSLQSHQE